VDVRHIIASIDQAADVQVIDVASGRHLWAERFDKPVADLFDMQDEIVSRLANTLNAQLELDWVGSHCKGWPAATAFGGYRP
jgi:hypothetical protein